jgi:hypothetical protein
VRRTTRKSGCDVRFDVLTKLKQGFLLQLTFSPSTPHVPPHFVPLKETRDGRIASALANPVQFKLIGEISLPLGERILIQVTTLAQITEVLTAVEKTREVEENPALLADPPDDGR